MCFCLSGAYSSGLTVEGCCYCCRGSLAIPWLAQRLLLAMPFRYPGPTASLQYSTPLTFSNIQTSKFLYLVLCLCNLFDHTECVNRRLSHFDYFDKSLQIRNAIQVNKAEAPMLTCRLCYSSCPPTVNLLVI